MICKNLLKRICWFSKAKNEKHVVTIFTDVDCGYCRKLHQQMDDYNDLGITVRYLGLSSCAGIPSVNADEMEVVC
ncbi:thioredoxin fold domain-containing protein [Vibrio cyclitrophicus]